MESCLEIAHERAIDQSSESKKRYNTDPDECHGWVVSSEERGNREGESDDEYPWEGTQWEDIATDPSHHPRIILMLRQFPYRDRIESEIGDDGEYREIVVDLGVESISCDIEISCEDLDEIDRDQGSEDLGSDLSECVGVDFASRHIGREYMIKNRIYG
jgi:hypothetical protein